jgi:hypothetical protein
MQIARETLGFGGRKRPASAENRGSTVSLSQDKSQRETAAALIGTLGQKYSQKLDCRAWAGAPSNTTSPLFMIST